jgi:hypothetical protein
MKTLAVRMTRRYWHEHRPFLHASGAVQGFPSSQAVALGLPVHGDVVVVVCAAQLGAPDAMMSMS